MFLFVKVIHAFRSSLSSELFHLQLKVLGIFFLIDLGLCQSPINTNGFAPSKIVYLNVAGELIATTYSTLAYIPNTKLSALDAWPRDHQGYRFLDLPPDLFKHFFKQLRRWSVRNNRSADVAFEPPSWEVKDEFNEMLLALDLHKYRQSKRNKPSSLS